MPHTQLLTRGLRAAGVGALLAAGAASADLPFETVGRVETVSLPHGAHWIFVGDAIHRRTALVDVDDGRMLGTLDSG
jgi:hypothetical protein